MSLEPIYLYSDTDALMCLQRLGPIPGNKGVYALTPEQVAMLEGAEKQWAHEFNINDKVWVKLTDCGRAVYASDETAFWASIPQAKHGYTLPVEDDNGWSEWQLWRLMQTFGQHITMGMSPLFETTIRLSVPPPQPRAQQATESAPAAQTEPVGACAMCGGLCFDPIVQFGAPAEAQGEREALTDIQLRAMWRMAGGRFYGPNIETGTMPESELLPFLRSLVADKRKTTP